MSRAMRRWRAGVAGLGLTLAALSLTGIEPAAAAGCSGVVPGDVNGDGYAEVAVSSRPGAVHVFYGHPSGPQVDAKGKARDDQEFTQDTPGIPGTRSLHDQFGQSTAFGDYNGDGCADLAIGDPQDFAVSGTVTILYGSPHGLTTKAVTRLVARESLPADWSVRNFGDRISSGDLNHDGRDDVIAGLPDAIDTGSDIGETALAVYTADAQGSWKAIAVAPEEDLGAPYSTSISSFAVGDFDGNGRSELAVTVGGIGVLSFAGDHLESFAANVISEGWLSVGHRRHQC